MKRFNNFHTLNVFSIELHQWPYEIHKHNFYELIFIEEGKGNHLINELSIGYEKGDILLLTPDDAHEFKIDEKTIFSFIKFDEKLLSNDITYKTKAEWIHSFKMLLAHPENLHGRLLLSDEDKKNAFLILKTMQSEFKRNELYHEDILFNLFGALVIIFVRSVAFCTRGIPKENRADLTRLNSILAYIRLYSLDNKKMKIESLARHFNMSTNYVSAYVKKHTGLPVQQHTIQAKVKNAEILLKQKKFRINEIALQLGFNDTSHFNKIFKKYKGVRPSSYE